MFFIPLNQAESVELVIHALRMAGGQADCTSCPARKVCMKQCLSIADAVAGMIKAGTLPAIEVGDDPAPEKPATKPETTDAPRDGHLKVIK